MTKQQIINILEEVHGIGNRECSPSPDQTIRLCAAILFMHGVVLNSDGSKISTMNIYGSMAIKNVADMLFNLSITDIIHDVKRGIEELKIED